MHFDEDGWLDVAKEYNISDNSWDRGGVPPSHLVIHGTAGGSNGNDTLAYEATAGVSTHFALSTNGDIWQGVPCTNKAAWGNAPLKSPTMNFACADLNPNLWTISIEFCKPDTTNQIDITDAQKQSGFALIAAICDNYNIPKRRGDGNGGIIGHCDINSVDRSHCPGTFPWDDLWTFLNQNGGDTTVLTIDQVSNYFTETTPGQRWHCKQTNQDIAFGILTYYRTCSGIGLNGLSQFGLPVSPENSVPGHPGVTFQIMERGVIVYDPKHEVDSVPGITGPCYPGHLDKFLPQSPQNAPQTPVVVPNTQAAISTIQAVTTALQSAIPALQSAAKDLEPS